MAKSVVAITQGTDPEKMIEEALNLLGGVEKLIRPGTTVIIKPNVIGKYRAERSVTTSPAHVAAAIKVLRKANPKQIILAESSAMGRNSLECMEFSGIKKAAEEAGIDRLVDVKQETDLVKMPIRDPHSTITSMMMPKLLLEADHIVNLPIMKMHVSATYSCCLKNIKGTVQDKVHLQMHQTDLSGAIVDAWSVIKPDLQIVDMMNPLEGFGPIGGIPMHFGCVVAGKDPVAVDATCCRMVGLDLAKATVFDRARDIDFGKQEEKDIEVRGKQVKDVYKQMWMPHLGGMNQWPEYNIMTKGSCSSCQALLAYGMERLKSLDGYDPNKGMYVVIGGANKIPEGVDPNQVILMGDCTKKHKGKGIFVEGCPPLEMQPTWTIIDKKYEVPAESKRVYADEIPLFLDYVKRIRPKNLGKDGTAMDKA